MLLAGCAVDPALEGQLAEGNIVCDSYIVLDMCVRDLYGDGAVDMIYFTDTNEIFMYRQGMKDAVEEFMPFHQCAVPLSAGMQDITNQILLRADLSLSEELVVTKQLFVNYMAAKPEIDACNARFAEKNGDIPGSPEEFYMEESEWEEGWED